MRGILFKKSNLEIVGVLDNVEAITDDIEKSFDTLMNVNTHTVTNELNEVVTVRESFNLFECDFIKVKNDFKFITENGVIEIALGLIMPYIPESVKQTSEIEQLWDTVNWLMM